MMPTMKDLAKKYLSIDTLEEENIFPVLKECYVNIQSEIGDNWGGLESCGFTEKQLSNKIHTVTVSLSNCYDEDGLPETGIYDEFLIVDWDFLSNFGFSISPVDYDAKKDSEEETHWFLNHSKAEKFANLLFKHLQNIGYKPIKKYSW